MSSVSASGDPTPRFVTDTMRVHTAVATTTVVLVCFGLALGVAAGRRKYDTSFKGYRDDVLNVHLTCHTHDDVGTCSQPHGLLLLPPRTHSRVLVGYITGLVPWQGGSKLSTSTFTAPTTASNMPECSTFLTLSCQRLYAPPPSLLTSPAPDCAAQRGCSQQCSCSDPYEYLTAVLPRMCVPPHDRKRIPTAGSSTSSRRSSNVGGVSRMMTCKL